MNLKITIFSLGCCFEARCMMIVPNETTDKDFRATMFGTWD
jgi:hypothetical protein